MPPSPDAAPLPYLDWILWSSLRDFIALGGTNRHCLPKSYRYLDGEEDLEGTYQ